MYEPFFLTIRELSIDVRFTRCESELPTSIAFSPRNLKLEAGIEDIYDALEARYGWERFQREVRTALETKMGFAVDEINITGITIKESSDEEQQEEDVKSFLAEHSPSDLEPLGAEDSPDDDSDGVVAMYLEGIGSSGLSPDIADILEEAEALGLIGDTESDRGGES